MVDVSLIFEVSERASLKDIIDNPKQYILCFSVSVFSRTLRAPRGTDRMRHEPYDRDIMTPSHHQRLEGYWQRSDDVVFGGETVAICSKCVCGDYSFECAVRNNAKLA